ncbi:MAG: hypothetical protein ABI651_17370 [Verrucomicrobiota bacterium]
MLRKFGFPTIAVTLIVVLAAWWTRISLSLSLETPSELKTSRIEAAPMCPWREPDADLRAFFPEATRYETETRILSGLRVELADRLGRMPTAEENALHLYRVFREQEPIGTILIRRVKGEYGAMEIVLAVSQNAQVRGVRLQRSREPESVANIIERPSWLNAFQGKEVQDKWVLGLNIPEVPDEARTSAKAIVDGVRSLLILLDTAGNPNAITTRSHHP